MKRVLPLSLIIWAAAAALTSCSEAPGPKSAPPEPAAEVPPQPDNIPLADADPDVQTDGAEEGSAFSMPRLALATLRRPDGAAGGSALLTMQEDGIRIEVTILPDTLDPGPYAFHIHETGACAPPDVAGAGAPQAGELHTIEVTAGATIHAEYLNPRVALRAGPAALLDADGAALIIHPEADDHAGRPEGAAGAQVLCGVIEPAPAAEGDGDTIENEAEESGPPF